MKKILWFDIETVAEVSGYMAYNKQRLWAEKCRDNKFPGLNEEESFYKNAGIYPEFARVVCISVYVDWKKVSFSNRISEKAILEEFFKFLDEYPDHVLGGFNIIGFDIPFLRKRAVIQGIKPHKKLCVGDIKPWERNEVDVMNLRKQGSFSCSLDLLSMTLLGMSPKTGEVSGKDIFEVFYWERPQDEKLWEDKRLGKIVKYCEKDVEYTVKCYNKIQLILGNEIVSEEKLPARREDVDEEKIFAPKGTASEKQKEFIKVLWKGIAKYTDIPDFEKRLDEYLKRMYNISSLDGLMKEQASWLVAVLNEIKSKDHPKILAIKRDLEIKDTGLSDDLPF